MKNYKCNVESLEKINDVLKKFDMGQKNTFYAIQELWCSYKNLYAIGEKLCLKMDLNASCEFITVNKTIGHGGSKKAVLLNDDRVIMFPNMDNMANRDVRDTVNILSFAHWWPKCVEGEASMATFLENIDLPALNRKQAYLVIENEEGFSYNLPILLSDSFKQYAERGWFVNDGKNSHSTEHSNQENWEMDIDSLKSIISPLITDVWKLIANGIHPGTDSRNTVLIQTGENFILRYFGFDFGGARGVSGIPDLDKATKEVKWDQSTFTFVSEQINYMISDFINSKFNDDKKLYKNCFESIDVTKELSDHYYENCYKEITEYYDDCCECIADKYKISQELSNKANVVYQFNQEAIKYFSSLDFIKETVNNFHNIHEDL